MGQKRKQGVKNPPSEAQPPTKKSKKSHHEPAAAPQVSSIEPKKFDQSPFLPSLDRDDDKRSQRQREFALYEALGSVCEADRLAAASALITGLLASEEDTISRHLKNRLFRGLASSRNASRVGFSLALTEILRALFGSKNLSGSNFSGLTFEKVLGILVEKTESPENLRGQEHRDNCYGRLFGLQCFVESGVPFEQNGDSARWQAVLDLLLSLSSKKVWLRPQCAWLIVLAVLQMGEAKATETVQKLLDAGLGKTADAVGIWLKVIMCYPDIKLPKKPWSNPLETKSIPELANVLKENVRQDDGSQAANVASAKQGNWTAQMHFVWDVILEYYVKHVQTSKESKSDQFRTFWNTVIDDGLFSKNATEAQKFRGFMIFQKFMSGLANTDDRFLVKELFSRNLMKCMMNQSAVVDRYLHRAALKSLKAIETLAEEHRVLLPLILGELLGKRGAYDFDRVTHTKTIEALLTRADPERIETILDLLQGAVAKPKDAEQADNMRMIYAHYLSKLCNNESTTTDTTSEAVISEMAKHAYSKSSFSPDISEKTREFLRSKLAVTFSKLAKQRDGYRRFCDAVLSIEPSAVQMSEELKTERKSATKTLKKLLKASNKSNKDEPDTSLAFALLYAVGLLQLYNGEPEAVSTFGDLKLCSEKLQEGDAAVSELLVDILLSLISQPSALMRQISQQVFEAFTSQLSEGALTRLTEPLTVEENEKGKRVLFQEADEEMLDVHESGNSEDDDSQIEEDDMSEIGSDVEFVTLNGTELADDDADKEEEEEEDDDDDEADEKSDEENEDNTQNDAQEYARLDAALEGVLGTCQLKTDKDAQSSSDSDADMTDSEMLALDDKLAEVFRQRAIHTGKPGASKKKERKSAKDTVVNFKLRILDFLAIYVRCEAYRGAQTFHAVLIPLLRLVRETSTKTVANKAAEVVADFYRAFKKGRGAQGGRVSKETQKGSDKKAELNERERLLDLLRNIHAEASKAQSAAFAHTASTASLLVASALYSGAGMGDDDSEVDVKQERENNVRDVARVYAETQVKWALGEVKMQSSFFMEWLKWCASHASTAN